MQRFYTPQKASVEPRSADGHTSCLSTSLDPEKKLKPLTKHPLGGITQSANWQAKNQTTYVGKPRTHDGRMLPCGCQYRVKRAGTQHPRNRSPAREPNFKDRPRAPAFVTQSGKTKTETSSEASVWGSYPKPKTCKHSADKPTIRVTMHERETGRNAPSLEPVPNLGAELTGSTA